MNTFSRCQSLAQIQSLEARRLLAVQVSFDPDIGMIQVLGDASNDHIDVLLQFGVDGPPPVIGMLVTVRDAGVEVFSGYFLEGQLTELRIAGGYGNDTIAMSNFDSPVNTLIFGEHGDDTIDAFTAGRAIPSVINGGEDDDVITLTNGREALDGYIASGDGGHDTIHGSRFSDVLYGDADIFDPRDFVATPGNDVIHGGGGNDALHGGAGSDLLFGEDGDDFLNGGAGEDVMHGGAGNDLAVIDSDDKVFEIEEIMVLIEP